MSQDSAVLLKYIAKRERRETKTTIAYEVISRSTRLDSA